GQLQAASTSDVILPHLSGSQRSTRGKMLTGHQVGAIRHPSGVIEQAEIFLGYLTGFAAVRLHHPDIVPTAGIAGKGDPLPIGTEPGLYFIRKAGSQGFGLTSSSWNGIYIS